MTKQRRSLDDQDTGITITLVEAFDHAASSGDQFDFMYSVAKMIYLRNPDAIDPNYLLTAGIMPYSISLKGGDLRKIAEDLHDIFREAHDKGMMFMSEPIEDMKSPTGNMIDKITGNHQPEIILTAVLPLVELAKQENLSMWENSAPLNEKARKSRKLSI